MPQGTCSIDGCGRPVTARGWCSTHYARWRRSGDPSGDWRTRRTTQTAYEWVMANAVLTASGCLEYDGMPHVQGYGRVGIDGQKMLAHRVVLIHHQGLDPDRPCCMHSCDNPPCVNIDHLRWGTHAENMADMMAKGRHWAQK